MADASDYARALDALLTALRTPDADRRDLSWLAGEIEQELQRTESESHSAWVADHPDSDAEPDSVLAANERFEIALRVMYHHLVSVPSMWAYVQGFWGRRRRTRVVVIDSARQEPIELAEDTAVHTADTELAFLRRLIDTLSQRYGLSLTANWLQREEGERGH